MSKNKEKDTKVVETATVETEEQKEEEEKLPTEVDFKNADSPEKKLELMKKLLENQKTPEAKKQKLIYKAMANITVVRN